jgi:hypothetical protein
MNDLFHATNALHYDESDHVAPITLGESLVMAEQAEALLAKGGWSGADMEFFERCMALQEDDPDAPQYLQEMAEAREREENLRK